MSGAGFASPEDRSRENVDPPYYVGTLSLRGVRQAVRGLLFSVIAVGLWWFVIQAFTSGHLDHPLTWLICGLFGSIAMMFTLVAYGFGRGFVNGGIFQQTIDESGVRAWHPFWPYLIPWERIDEIRPWPRWPGRRVYVCVRFSTWGILNGPLLLWTDAGMTREEFDDLYDDLVSRGFE